MVPACCRLDWQEQKTNFHQACAVVVADVAAVAAVVVDDARGGRWARRRRALLMPQVCGGEQTWPFWKMETPPLRLQRQRQRQLQLQQPPRVE